MSDKNVLHFSIAPLKDVRQDLRKNANWLISIACILLIYILAVSALASKLENWTYLHAAYFTVINTTTVGFGDVLPVTRLGKLLAGINAFVGLIAFGFFVSVLTMALQPGSVSSTIDLPKDEGDAPKEKHPTDIETTLGDFFRGLDGLVKAGANDPGEKQQNQERPGSARIYIRRFEPRYLRIDIHIDY